MAEETGLLPRLVDYIALVDLDLEQLEYDRSNGIVTHRFPREDWTSPHFPASLSTICQPWGWQLSTEARPSTFFFTKLTDVSGLHQFACCMQRWEKCEPSELPDSCFGSTVLYRPKVYAILSRHAFFKLFMLCLRKISQSHEEGDNRGVENMIATLLGGVALRIGENVSFNLGDERLSVRAPSSTMIPVSGGCVSAFARSLGINGMLLVMRAVLCEQRLVLTSAFARMLSIGSHAINILLYPFEYSFTEITVAPRQLFDYLESPSPLIAGILKSDLEFVENKEEWMVVDLDTGRVDLPSSLHVPEVPEPFLSQLVDSLQAIMQPDLKFIDMVNAPPSPPKPDDEIMDSQIRACFMRFYADIIEGYRNALLLVRVFPKPSITFHHAAFIGFRKLQKCVDSSFMHALLTSHMFQVFVTNRGLPYRICDAFDYEVSRRSSVPSTSASLRMWDENLRELASVIFINEQQESVLPQTPSSRKASVTESAAPTGPLDETNVELLLVRLRSASPPPPSIAPTPRIVPDTPLNVEEEESAEARQRRFKVLEECFSSIMDNRIAEARKKMPAIEFALRSRSVRVRLCALLVKGMIPVYKATLAPQQFELIVRLMNCALAEESVHDEHGIAYACLFCSYVYCRKLTQGVQQYAYTCIQNHDVWKNEKFWESAFFHDLNRLMRQQYIDEGKGCTDFVISGSHDTWGLFEEPTAMQLFARKFREWNELSDEEKTKRGLDEDSIVFGQAKHYINLMVYLRVPLDRSRIIRIENQKKERKRTASESENSQGEDDTEKQEELRKETTETIARAITRIIDRIGMSAGLDGPQIGKLTSLVEPCIEMQIENIEQVYIESSKLPPPPKMEISPPALLANERFPCPMLRTFLLCEGKNDRPADPYTWLIPAEGALFLTNYRLIFKGHPIHPLYTDEVVIRSAPLMSLVKEKFLDDVNAKSPMLASVPAKVASSLHHCWQVRSSTFTLMTLMFDEEVESDTISSFIKTLRGLRWPSRLPATIFCFHEHAEYLKALDAKEQATSSSTIKDIRKAIVKLPRGIQGSVARRRFDYLPTIPRSGEKSVNQEDYLDVQEVLTSARKAEYSLELSRLRFDSDNGLFRVSHANHDYSVCSSYPSAFAIPSTVNDEVLGKIAKGFRNGRFPVVTWIHEKGAILVRGAAFTTPNVVSRIKKAKDRRDADAMSVSSLSLTSPTAAAKRSTAPAMTPLTSSAHQEHYIRRLVACSPSPSSNSDIFCGSFSSLAQSNESLHSSAQSSVFQKPSDLAKELTKAANFVRHSSNRGTMHKSNGVPSLRQSEDSEGQKRVTATLTQRSLYIFGERGLHKAFRLDKNIDYIPTVYPTTREMKESFSLFIRFIRQRWNSPVYFGGKSYLRMLEETRWIEHVSCLLRQSTVIATLLTHFNCSVALCIEEGDDATCQLSSLAQIIADPFYRTIKGFERLVSKDWLSFGHRFSYRSNHTSAAQRSDFAPLTVQFPSAFEYNDFFLRFVAYHSQSTYFRTFLFDNEAERCSVESVVPDRTNEHCIWKYIKLEQERRGRFTNYLYNPNDTGVLDVRFSVALMEVWPYYSEDFLQHGPPYDIELCEREIAKHVEEQAKQDETKTTIETEKACSHLDQFSSRDLRNVNFFDVQLDRLRAISPMLSNGNTTSTLTKWRQSLEKMDAENNDFDEQSRVNELSNYARKAVLRTLWTGRNVIPTATLPNGTASSSEMRADMTVRESFAKIDEEEPSPVTPPVLDSRPPRPPSHYEFATPHQGLPSNGHASTMPLSEVNSPASPVRPVIRPANAHAGILYKKGATFKFWSPRWYVLDEQRLKMLYFDNQESPICRGEIDLVDLEAIEVNGNVPYVQRKGTAVLELRLRRRSYSFLANSKKEAEEWRDKITSIL